ncbi:MAG: phage major capsid protein [Comamonadaceae bacterium]|nr:MAG: phage major capsid protein [Comamonadaceae bacterium]
MSMLTQRADLLSRAKSIITTCQVRGRDMTRPEKSTFDSIISEIDALDVQIKAADVDQERLGRLKALTPYAMSGDQSQGYLTPNVKGYAQSVTDQFRTPGQKSLAATGTVVADVPMDPEPIQLGRPATGLWDLIPTVRQSAANYTYLRQSVRTNNAAMVAPGELKPTSVYTIVNVDGRMRVVAHLSEPIDRFLLEDNSNLRSFVQSEMLTGIFDTLAAEVLTGDGTDEHLTGIANVSGIQTQAASGDTLRTLRSALTKLELFGVAPRGFAVNAADWEAVESTRNTSGNFDVGGPVDAASRRAWGTPVAVVPGIPAKTAYLIGEDTVQLRIDRAGIRADYGTPGDTFKYNQLVARVETRASLDVLRPVGIVKIALPA